MNLSDKMSLGFDDVLLVPQHTLLESRKDAELDTSLHAGPPEWVMVSHPILSANMPAVTEGEMAAAMYKLGGFGFLHRFQHGTRKESIARNVEMYKEVVSVKADCGVSLGIHEGMDRLQALHWAGARTFLIDVAHGDSEPVIRFVKQCVELAPFCAFIVGNVATADGAMRLVEAGASAIKVGIGPGAACTTRTVTGAGRGQLTAIMECSEAVAVPIIADGGIRNSGDIVKALAAGASTVMVGRLLAGCDESPYPGQYWGNASARQNNHRAPEGISGSVELSGTLEDTLKSLLWGVRSGISYSGASGISDLAECAVFERVAPGVAAETATRLA